MGVSSLVAFFQKVCVLGLVSSVVTGPLPPISGLLRTFAPKDKQATDISLDPK
jgi:hypothetical protein